MPEGPEIHAQASRLRNLLEGQCPKIECPWPQLRAQVEALEGQQITCLRARGKAFLITFESGLTLYAHMQLYGRWRIVSRGVTPSSRRQLRLRFSGLVQDALLYSATDVHLLNPEQLKAQPYLARLGPDLLDPDLSEEPFLARLQHPDWRGRQLAGLLLDQSFWAGPGNYLRSEILFCAGLAPQDRPRDLSDLQARCLVRVARGLAHRSLLSGGLTNHPLLVAALKRQRKPRRHYRHWVFQRDGQPCLLCQHPIGRQEWTSRRLYRCLHCRGCRDLTLDFSDLAVTK